LLLEPQAAMARAAVAASATATPLRMDINPPPESLTGVLYIASITDNQESIIVAHSSLRDYHRRR
jgi:hypothetical protein